MAVCWRTQTQPIKHPPFLSSLADIASMFLLHSYSGDPVCDTKINVSALSVSDKGGESLQSHEKAWQGPRGSRAMAVSQKKDTKLFIVFPNNNEEALWIKMLQCRHYFLINYCEEKVGDIYQGKNKQKKVDKKDSEREREMDREWGGFTTLWIQHCCLESESWSTGGWSAQDGLGATSVLCLCG